MKKILYLTAVASAALVSFTSCGNNWLEEQPSTYVSSSQGITALSDVSAMENGVYAQMQNAYTYCGRFIYYGDVTADDMQAVSTTKRTGNAYLYSFTQTSMQNSYWSYPYSMLNSVNTVLASIDAISVSGTDATKRDYYKGVALTMRAMFHFELVKFFGYPYKKDNGASLGVPVVTRVVDGSEKLSRNTVAEVYTQIIKDLEDADALLDNSLGNAVSNGYITRPAVLTLLSRVYLYHGDNDKALTMAEKAIKCAEDAGFTLWTNANYATAWANSCASGNEILFNIVNSATENPDKESIAYLYSSSQGPYTPKGGYDDACVTASFYKMLAEDPNDVRLQLIRVDKKGIPYLYKYQLQSDESDITTADVPLIRLSEAYLNAAEAAVKTNNNAKAVTYLNAIVHRANPANTVSGTVTIEQVMKERRKELVGEGHRFYDALRDGGSFQREDALDDPAVVAAGIKQAHLGTYTKFDWNNKNTVLPIPTAEIDANKNITQNTGF